MIDYRETLLAIYHVSCLIGNDLIGGILGPSIFLFRLRKKMPEFFMDNVPIHLPSSFYVHTPSHKPRDQWTKDTPMFKLAKSKPRVIIVEEANQVHAISEARLEVIHENIDQDEKLIFAEIENVFDNRQFSETTEQVNLKQELC